MKDLELHEILEKSAKESSEEAATSARSPSGTHVKRNGKWVSAQPKQVPHRIQVKLSYGGREYERLLDGIQDQSHLGASKKILHAVKSLQKRYPDLKVVALKPPTKLAQPAAGSEDASGMMPKAQPQTEARKIDLNSIERVLSDAVSAPSVEILKRTLRKSAPGDAGRLTQGFPIEQARFDLPGSSVTLSDCQDFVKEFEADFGKLRWALAELIQPGLSTFAARLKDPGSLLRKMKAKLSDRSLNTVTDVVGARVVCKTLAEQQRILEKVKQLLTVRELEHSVDAPRVGGYRGIHSLLESASGKLWELQIKTVLQQVFSSFVYQPIYKQNPELQEVPEVKHYLEDLSKLLYEVDCGAPVPISADRPLEPRVLQDMGISFPWAKLPALEEELQKSANRKPQYFVIVHLLGTSILEFDHLDQAFAWMHARKLGGFGGTMIPAFAPNETGLFLALGNYSALAPTEAVELGSLAQALSRFHN